MSVSTKFYNPGFVNPFANYHCVPLAFTALQPPARRTAEFAILLADRARRVATSDGYLLNKRGGSVGTRYHIAEWAKLAGFKIVDRFIPETTYVDGFRSQYSPRYGEIIDVRFTRRVGRPTVAAFLRTTGRKGSWFILTHRHAQAAINGRLKGNVSRRDRVHAAFLLEAL